MIPAALTLSYWHLPSVLVLTDLGLLTLGPSFVIQTSSFAFLASLARFPTIVKYAAILS